MKEQQDINQAAEIFLNLAALYMGEDLVLGQDGKRPNVSISTPAGVFAGAKDSRFQACFMVEPPVENPRDLTEPNQVIEGIARSLRSAAGLTAPRRRYFDKSPVYRDGAIQEARGVAIQDKYYLTYEDGTPKYASPEASLKVFLTDMAEAAKTLRVAYRRAAFAATQQIMLTGKAGMNDFGFEAVTRNFLLPEEKRDAAKRFLEKVATVRIACLPQPEKRRLLTPEEMKKIWDSFVYPQNAAAKKPRKPDMTVLLENYDIK